MKWFKKWLGRKSVHSSIVEDLQFADDDGDELTSDIAQNEMILRNIFHNCSDIVFRKIQYPGKFNGLSYILKVWLTKSILTNSVLKPLISECYNARRLYT